jgi:Flp pilus assembly protein TadB
MVPVFALWLPILVSAVLVFVASSLIHMVLKYHASDHRPVPQEDALAELLRPLEPGQYTIPYAGSMKEMGEPAFVEKMKRGPIAIITMRRAGSAGVGPSLAAWFVFSIAVSIFAAYVAGRALGPGADYLAVFRFAGTTALVAYAVGGWQESIWYGRPWGTTVKNTIDGVIYAAITAGVFGWLWPAA